MAKRHCVAATPQAGPWPCWPQSHQSGRTNVVHESWGWHVWHTWHLHGMLSAVCRGLPDQMASVAACPCLWSGGSRQGLQWHVTCSGCGLPGAEGCRTRVRPSGHECHQPSVVTCHLLVTAPGAWQLNLSSAAAGCSGSAVSAEPVGAAGPVGAGAVAAAQVPYWPDSSK